MIYELKNTWTILDQPEKNRFGKLVFLDVLISIMDIGSLALLLWIIRYYLQPAEQDLLLPSWVQPLYLIAAFFIVFILKNVAAFYITRAQFRLASRVATRISANNMSSYQHAEFAEYINVDSSVQVRKIGFQPFEFCQYMLTGMQQVITQATLVTITIIAILLFNATLFLLLLVMLLPPMILVFYYIKKRLGKLRSRIRQSNERSFQFMMDALKGYVESNIYGRNSFFLDRFIKQRKEFSHHLFDSLGIQVMPSRVIEIFAIAGLFVLMAIANRYGNDGSSTMITLGAFLAAAYKIIPGVVKIINLNGQMKAFEFSPGDLLPAGKAENSKSQPIKVDAIRFEDIYFNYGELQVLKGIMFEINKGDFVGIKARSGKGKTTILNLMLGFLEPASGCIYINNEAASPNDLRNLWPQVAYVRQQGFFIHDTIVKNITLEDQVSDMDRLNCAIKTSGVNELASQYPEGLEKLISENGKNISGGQQQRISVARAMYKDAEIILLDEPFNELDVASEKQLLEHFKKMAASGRIVIMITHHQESLSVCNKIIDLDGA